MEHRKQLYNPEDIPDFSELEDRGWDAMHQMLDEYMPQKKEKPRVIPIYWRWMAAAIVLLLAGVGSYRLLTEKANTHLPDTSFTGTTTSSGNASDKEILKNTASDDKKKDSGIITDNRITDVNTTDNKKMSSVLTKVSHNHLPQTVHPQYRNADNTGRIAGQTRLIAPNRESVLTASGLVKGNGNEQEMTLGKINMDFTNKNLADNIPKQSVVKMNFDNKENVEAASEFRKRMNQALADERKSDSAGQASVAKIKKAQADSQLTAKRREQLEQYFGQKENTAKEEILNRKAKVDLAVLVNRSMTGDKTNANNSSIYGLPVYPAVSASVRLSEKIGFTTGVGTAAPGNFTDVSTGSPVLMSSPAYAASSVAGSHSFDSKTFVNTSSTTMALSAGLPMEVQQAYYWQIPLTFDYYVMSSRLKFSAGTDFSIIQKVLVGNASGSQLMSSGAYNNSGGAYRVRNFDPRLSVGAQYRLNRFLVGTRFSRSFQSALQYNGAPINGGNNQVFNISVGYSFMK